MYVSQKPAKGTVFSQIIRVTHTEGRSGVALPDALERKYPRAGHSWPWFWVFAQHTHSTDPRSGVVRRHHMYDQTFQRAFKRAVEQAGRGLLVFSAISDGTKS